jgi:sigma-B regulation protein RsbU (phosphoserine phosphatase)
MVKTGTLFRSLGKQLTAPEKLLQQINEELCETAIRGMFVTMIAGLYDPRRGQLRLVNAGHPPALLVADHGKVKAIAAAAPPLGIVSGHEFPAINLTLGRGALCLFSDGVIEAKLDDGRILGLDGLIRLLVMLCQLPPANRLEAIVAHLQRGRSSPADDITLLLLEDAHAVT